MKLVGFSDTHMKFPEFLPAAKYHVFAGDYESGANTPEDAEAIANMFLKWFSTQDSQFKVIVPGNHDNHFWNDKAAFRKMCERYNVTLLDHETVRLGNVTFFGSPYFYVGPVHPQRLRHDTPEPDSFDVIVTHVPPYGVGDFATKKKQNCGSPELRAFIDANKIKCHIFGHIHEGALRASPFYNVAMTARDKPKLLVNPPLLIEADHLASPDPVPVVALDHPWDDELDRPLRMFYLEDREWLEYLLDLVLVQQPFVHGTKIYLGARVARWHVPNSVFSFTYQVAKENEAPKQFTLYSSELNQSIEVKTLRELKEAIANVSRG